MTYFANKNLFFDGIYPGFSKENSAQPHDSHSAEFGNNIVDFLNKIIFSEKSPETSTQEEEVIKESEIIIPLANTVSAEDITVTLTDDDTKLIVTIKENPLEDSKWESKAEYTYTAQAAFDYGELSIKLEDNKLVLFAPLVEDKKKKNNPSGITINREN